MTGFAHLPDPVTIYQTHLDTLSDALLCGNFTRFAAGIALPFRIITETSERLIASKDELSEAFFAMNRTLKAQGVTEYLRLASSATYTSETRICGHHVTHILRDGKRLTPPYPNRIRLELVGGVWCETVAANAIQRDTKSMLLPKVAAQPYLPEIKEYDPERTPQ